MPGPAVPVHPARRPSASSPEHRAYRGSSRSLMAHGTEQPRLLRPKSNGTQVVVLLAAERIARPTRRRRWNAVSLSAFSPAPLPAVAPDLETRRRRRPRNPRALSLRAARRHIPVATVHTPDPSSHPVACRTPGGGSHQARRPPPARRGRASPPPGTRFPGWPAAVPRRAGTRHHRRPCHPRPAARGGRGPPPGRDVAPRGHAAAGRFRPSSRPPQARRVPCSPVQDVQGFFQVRRTSARRGRAPHRAPPAATIMRSKRYSRLAALTAPPRPGRAGTTPGPQSIRRRPLRCPAMSIHSPITQASWHAGVVRRWELQPQW